MKGLMDKAIEYYTIAIAFLIAVMATLAVIARYAEYVPLFLLVVAFVAAAWRWARGDWG